MKSLMKVARLPVMGECKGLKKTVLLLINHFRHEETSGMSR